MPSLRSIALVVLVTVVGCASTLSAPTKNVPDTCSVTKPEDHPFVPPPHYPAKAPDGNFWFGTDELWTVLPIDGTWGALPHYTFGDPTFRQKLFFWHQGYDWHTEPQPPLTVTGRRLDAPAPPLMADRANAGWQNRDQPFMVTGINLPALGCWEITGHYEAHDLTFVVWVWQ